MNVDFKTRKFVLLLIVVITGLTTFSCEKSEETTRSKTEVNIRLKNYQEELVSDVVVYMFDNPSTHTFGSKPMYATKESVTDDKGIAHFNLKSEMEIEDQKTYYFTVLATTSYQKYTVLNSVAVSVLKGEQVTKDLFIDIN